MIQKLKIKSNMRLETQENSNFEEYFSHEMEENWGRTDEEHFDHTCLNMRREYFTCIDLQNFWMKSKRAFLKKKGIQQFKRENKKISLFYYSEATDYGHKPILRTLRSYIVEQLCTFLCFKIMRTDSMVEKALRSIIKKGQRLVIQKFNESKHHQKAGESLGDLNKNIRGLHICLNILILKDNKAYAANIGGNRLFFIQRTKFRKFFEAKFLTAYHTNENVIEMYRVKREQSG
jgi:hypothetical protein